jgi:hypothetical protein
MFERFRRSSAPADEPGTVAVREREAADEAPTTIRKREPAAERDPDTAATTIHEREPAAERTAVRDPDTPAESTTIHERDRVAPERRRFRRTDRNGDVVPERRTVGPVVDTDTLVAMHARQRDRFGGIRWGSAFFGLLSAVGLASILLGIIVAAGVAIGLSEVEDTAKGTNDTIGVGGAIALLAVLAVAWACGGYVAGRMARFDGVRQGLGVWGWTILVGAAVAILAAIGGEEYNVFSQLNLPNIAVGDASLTTTGVVTLLCALVVTLVFAVVGGKVGDRFHRRVDRLAAREYVETT